jgi:hypothetical protein
MWYTSYMAIRFGTGPTLKEACSWLKDDAERHARILRVAECNSVIEGLPPFQEETRRRLAEQLAAIASSPQQVPNELPSSSAGSSS